MEEDLRQKNSNCIKVVLFGPESTGKTTLAKQLASYYKTDWVPEYMREYLQKKWDDHKEVCTYDDLIPIAKGQMRLENLLTRKADTLLFCDTNLLEIKTYSEAYYDGKVPVEIQKMAVENTYDLYLLTYIDIPWEADDLRDKPLEREKMFSIFEEALKRYDLPYVKIMGNQEERLTKAITAINQLIQ